MIKLPEMKLPAALTPKVQRNIILALVLTGVAWWGIGYRGRKQAEAPPLTGGEVQAFFRGVRAGQLPPVSGAVKLHASLATMKEEGSESTALHLAGSPEVAEVLLSTGADLEALADGKTPLHAAIENDRVAVAKFLVSRRASLSAKIKEPPYHAVQLAVARGKAAMAEMLLDLGAKLESTLPPNGESLLHIAAREGRPEVIELIIARGLDANVRDSPGRTPLFVATSTEVAKLLINRGASLAVRTGAGETLLVAKLKANEPAMARFLIETGLPLDHEHIGRALVAAAETHSPELLDLILTRQPEFRYKQEALFTAASLGERAMTETLAALGAGAAQDAQGRTAFHAAATRDVVDVLGQHGLFVDARDRGRRTPLFVAVAQGRQPVAEGLLGLGAEPGTVAAFGDTPLLVACAREDAPMAVLLVAHGAETNTRNRWGVTPLHYVARSGNLELAQLLLEKGADPLAKMTGRVSRPAEGADFIDPLAGLEAVGKTPVDLSTSTAVRSLLLKYKDR